VEAAGGWLPETVPLSARALEREAILRALRSMGVATLKQLRSHYAFARYVTQRALDALLREGAVAPLETPSWAPPRPAGRAQNREPSTCINS
jgi:uncharacterized protein YcaQ